MLLTAANYVIIFKNIHFTYNKMIFGNIRNDDNAQTDTA